MTASTYLILGHGGSPFEEIEAKKVLESGDLEAKINCMKKIIIALVDGENHPGLMFSIIRYILPMKEHQIKKLLLLYFELVPKIDEHGKLLQQMILVCDTFRKDITSPNEYVRGSTMRFLCKIKERDILEPLVPHIRDCLKHRHSYVRKNAILCINSIYQTHPAIISDAPDLIYSYINEEMDLLCKRNALLMLSQTSLDLAIQYLDACIDSILSLGEVLQLAVIDLIQIITKSKRAEASRPLYIQAVFNLATTAQPAVKLEAAKLLLQLTDSETGIRLAIQCLIDLVNKESDISVKSTILDQFSLLFQSPAQKNTLSNNIPSLLKSLACSDLIVRNKILSITIPCLKSENVEEIFSLLKKTLHRKSESDFAQEKEFKKNVLDLLHGCSNKFSHIRYHIFPLMVDFLKESDESICSAVVNYFKDLILLDSATYAPLVQRELMANLELAPSNKVFQLYLWILEELSKSEPDSLSLLTYLYTSVGALPLQEAKEEEQGKDLHHPQESSHASAHHNSALPLQTNPQKTLLANGGYKTQSAIEYQIQQSAKSGALWVSTATSLRQRLLAGNLFDLGQALALCITKLNLKLRKGLLDSTMSESPLFLSSSDVQRLSTHGMLVMTSIIRVAYRNGILSHMSQYNVEVIVSCIQHLMDPNKDLLEIHTQECSSNFEALTRSSLDNPFGESDLLDDTKLHLSGIISILNDSSNNALGNARAANVAVADDIDFGLEDHENAPTAHFSESQIELQRALGAVNFAHGDASNITKVFQLAGFTDPVYAEAYIIVENCNVLLDIMLVNQSDDTLQNFTLEISTVGDIRLKDRIQPHTIAPQGVLMLKVHLHMNSSDRSIIYPAATYNIRGVAEKCTIILNDITVDVLDFILPSTCTATEFRTKWQSFEWENKVLVDTNITSLYQYLQRIIDCTNMRPINRGINYDDHTEFLAVNMCAKSLFGEDALANLCIQLDQNGNITGHIRIRAKYQGIALSLGDKINLSQNLLSVPQ